MIVPHISPTLDIHPNIVVVGSGSILLDHKQGEIIDSFDEVVRFNRAPTKGFEKFVGGKTTVRVANQHVFACHPWRGRWSPQEQPKNFIRNQRNCKIVCLGPNCKRAALHSSCTPYKANYSQIPKNGDKNCTVGLAFLHLLLAGGFLPHVYGFYGVDGEEGREGLSHYWEKRDNKAPHHNYRNERKILKEWHEQDKIIWHI